MQIQATWRVTENLRDLSTWGRTRTCFRLLRSGPVPKLRAATVLAGPLIPVPSSMRSSSRLSALWKQLRSAVRLAKQLRCQLIALYTDKFPDGLSEALAEAQPGQATALALRSSAARLLDVGTAIPPDPVSHCAIDISRKRNLGLLIGRACGWTRMLFLDDDIRKVSADKVSSAAALLSQYPVVGLQVTGFPDASVVGHARRMAGSGRKPFISGGSHASGPAAHARILSAGVPRGLALHNGSSPAR